MALKDFNVSSYLELKDKLNETGEGFCLAKWFNATIWLGNGMTTSCHHPPAHQIPIDEVKLDYTAIHNTVYKKEQRKQMLNGERPAECDYCWKIEDLSNTHISDRVYKSVIFDNDAISEAKEIGYTGNAQLKTLEIAFDANCNFACSYCNPSFSTKWMTDIRQNGWYGDLVSDGGGAYEQDGSWAMPYGKNNTNNPYVDAFMKWWENDLQYTLKELRVTGGEATMSNDFWKLVDWLTNNKTDVAFAVNTNLGVKKNLLDRLNNASKNIEKFSLYTSNESHGKHAEYIRDGLNYNEWLENVEYMIVNGNMHELNVMMTINALCLFSITEFMDDMIELKKKYGRKYFSMSFNILRFPSFQSIVTLPVEIREERAKHITEWLAKQSEHGMLHQSEVDGIVRMISYIKDIEVGHNHTSSLESRQRDFKTFFDDYDKRRGKSFTETFPMLKEWYDSLVSVKELTTEQRIYFSEKENWIRNKQGANPTSKDYIE